MFSEVAEQQAQVIADKLAGALMTDVRNSNNTVVAKVEELRNKMTAMESNNTKLSTDMKMENESVRRKLDTSNASLGSNLALLDNACKVVEKASVALDGTAVKIASIMDTVTEKMDGLITQTSNVVAKLDGLITGSVAQQEQHVQQQQHLLTVEEEQQAAEALEWLADQKRQEVGCPLIVTHYSDIPLQFIVLLQTDRAIAAAATKTFEDVVAEQDAKQRAFERRRLVRQCMENPLIMKNPRSRFGEFGGEVLSVLYRTLLIATHLSRPTMTLPATVASLLRPYSKTSSAATRTAAALAPEDTKRRPGMWFSSTKRWRLPCRARFIRRKKARLRRGSRCSISTPLLGNDYLYVW